MSTLPSKVVLKENSSDRVPFKKKYTFEQREREFAHIKAKFPTKIPVIVEPSNARAPKIDRYKYLIQSDFTIGQFIYMVRGRIKSAPEEAIFFFINGKLPVMSAMVSDLYTSDRDQDGFLYFTYSLENTFG